MELKEFIKQTIIQITDGLVEGHKYVNENNFGEGISDSSGKEINFDVAVTSNEEETTGIGGKISIANVFNIGAKEENTTKATNVSRIQFKTYLHLKMPKKK
ncbi:hypothetical protein [Flavobacterium sp. Arc2]|jgi:hypothetical protein|uniref:hypothetical protein n=1 Tax=Flavobacterium sp. Arc2 TaxID=3046685 RepID=UPI00352C7940